MLANNLDIGAALSHDENFPMRFLHANSNNYLILFTCLSPQSSPAHQRGFGSKANAAFTFRI